METELLRQSSMDRAKGAQPLAQSTEIVRAVSSAEGLRAAPPLSISAALATPGLAGGQAGSRAIRLQLFGTRTMSAKKLYAFPISKVFHLDLAGEEHFLRLRFRWDTGETEIAWEKPDVFKVGLIFEEPIPATSSPGRA